MRKILLVAILAVATIANAQCYTKFMGIEIKGNIDEFSAQLMKRGFKLEQKGLAGDVYSGKYMGENTVVTVYYTLKTHTAYGVSVAFDDNDTEEFVQRRYIGLQELLTGKYGEPAEKDVPFEDKYDYFSKDICTRWKNDCGGITLQNTHLSISKYERIRVVIISYWSMEGYELKDIELSEDL